MKALIPLFLLVLTSSISAKFRKHGRTALYCENEPRDVLCHDIDKPVLAFTVEGDYTKYKNPCFACSDPRVKYYYEVTKCPEVQNPINCQTIGFYCALRFDLSLEDEVNMCELCDNGGFLYFEEYCPYHKKYFKPSDIEISLKEKAENYADQFLDYPEY